MRLTKDEIERLRARLKSGHPFDPESIVVHLCEALLQREQDVADLMEALEPFAYFAEIIGGQPLSGSDDAVYGIHTDAGHAELKVSDCTKAKSLLARLREQEAK